MSTDETTETCGLFDAARILGVSPQRADQLSRQTGFPEPIEVTNPYGDALPKRRKWLRADVEAYQQARTTKQETPDA